jgi:hypothetical protein
MLHRGVHKAQPGKATIRKSLLKVSRAATLLQQALQERANT